jgi:hypothetical protein
MIEVRIPLIEICEYSQQSSLDAYIYGRLLAAGVPLVETGTPVREVIFSRDGVLEHVGDSVVQNCIVWRWHEKDEWPPAECWH